VCRDKIWGALSYHTAGNVAPLIRGYWQIFVLCTYGVHKRRILYMIRLYLYDMRSIFVETVVIDPEKTADAPGNTRR